MKTLKVISRLLCYPDEGMCAALDDMAEAVDAEGLLPAGHRQVLHDFIRTFRDADLYALQERYVNLFDRGRALSLHLFEHVHGESRDRGQAMVDLMDLYRSHGFELSARELPDYLPVFLEYLSERPAHEARTLLAEAMGVVALVGERLAHRQSDYAVPFAVLQAIAGPPGEIETIREQVAAEGPDETVVNMDRVWEEEAVRFLDPGGCGATAGERPVHWMKPRASHGMPERDSATGGRPS